MIRQYRQGDVLLCAVDGIPPAAKPVPREGARVVVALGELTGHAHAFDTAGVRLLREKGNGRSFLLIGEDGAPLCHEEHDPILLPEGCYEIMRQQENTAQAPRLVGD
jgi:hypothetical protein